MTQTLTILSPVPDRPAAAAAPGGPWDLPEPIRVGLLSNGKPNTSPLLDGVQAVLAADPRVVVGVRERKPSAAQAADRAVLERLAAAADLVVGATAD